MVHILFKIHRLKFEALPQSALFFFGSNFKQNLVNFKNSLEIHEISYLVNPRQERVARASARLIISLWRTFQTACDSVTQ